MRDIEEYIKILELSEYFKNMSQEEQGYALAEAWRKFSLKWHPDLNKSPEAEDKFKLGNEANEKLKDYIKNGNSKYYSNDDYTSDYRTRYEQKTNSNYDYSYHESNNDNQFYYKYAETECDDDSIVSIRRNLSIVVGMIIVVLIIISIIGNIFSTTPSNNIDTSQDIVTNQENVNTESSPTDKSVEPAPKSTYTPSEQDSSAGSPNSQQPNWGPYMRDLEQRIKRNWSPPKGDVSKRVIVSFIIAKDGKLLSNKIIQSSNIPAADKAALDAIELTAPYRPLPPEFKGESVPIEFTFDYNVLSPRGDY